MDLHTLNIEQAHKGLVEKDFSCEELTKSSLKRAHDRNGEINSFITITEELALAQAKKVDEKITQGDKIGVLEGIPAALKDNITVQGVRSTAGSQMLKDYIAPYNATVVNRLSDAGYVLIGKTNMDEFAMGSSTENSSFGTTKNPHDITRVPGGSSGGSAAAVADDQVIYALGSDTGGSIRQPAALCGCVGFKPTYGRISRYGLMAMASSLDQIGPFTKTVRDSAFVFDALYGKDPHDTTSVKRKENHAFSEVEYSLQGKRIGYAPETLTDAIDPEIKKTFEDSLKQMQQAGAEIVEVSMPHLKYALAAYYLIVFAEVSSNMGRYDGIRYGQSIPGQDLHEMYEKTRGATLGKEVQRRIMLGTYVLSAGYYDAYYKKAQKLRSLIIQDYAQVFKQVDCFVTPTTPSTAFKLGEFIDDPLTLYLEDIYTVPLNVAGLPGMSVPAGMSSKNLPIGIQFVASHFNEKTLFEVAGGFEHLQQK